MKTRKQKLRVLSLLMATIMLMVAFSTTAMAAGVETLPRGWYNIGAFTFTDTNTTPTKKHKPKRKNK